MNTSSSTVCHEVVRSRKGEVIGHREIVNEICDKGRLLICTTRGILKMADGRVVINTLIKREIIRLANPNYQMNFLTGRVV